MEVQENKFSKYSDEEIRCWVRGLILCPITAKLLTNEEYQELLDEAKRRGL